MHRSLPALLALTLLPCLAPALAEPGPAAAGLSYPLDGLACEKDLLARSLSGGVWLAGLPGYPRYNGRNAHAGLDLRATLGDPLYACADGVVDPASDAPHGGYGPGWSVGQVLIIRSYGPGGSTWLTVYGHTQNHLVHGGDVVRAGQPIGQIGPWLAKEGGPHLHLTIRLGDLPRYGWGTPTVGSRAREGAECVSCPADVVRLGYRDPAGFLRGDFARELLVGVDEQDRRYTEFSLRYLAGYGADPTVFGLPALPEGANVYGLPCADGFSKTERAKRVGRGVLQTLRREDGLSGCLTLRDGDVRCYWLHGPIYETWAAGGGPGVFGYPIGDEYDFGADRAQLCERMLIVWRRDVGWTRFEPR